MALRFLNWMRKYSRFEASGVRAKICDGSPPLRATNASRRSRAEVLKALGVTCEGWRIGSKRRRKHSLTRIVLGGGIVSFRDWGDKIRAANLARQALIRPLLALGKLRAHDGDVLEDFAPRHAHARAQNRATNARARFDAHVFPKHALRHARARFDRRGLVLHNVEPFLRHPFQRDVRVEVAPDGRKLVPVAFRDVRGYALAALDGGHVNVRHGVREDGFPARAARDVVEDASVEDLNPREHQRRVPAAAGLRVAAEAFDEAVAHVHDAVALARGVRAKDERRERSRSPVRFERGREVYVGRELSVDDDEVVRVEERSRVVYRAARAEYLRLFDVVEPHAEPELRAVAEGFAHGLGPVVKVDHNVVEALAREVLGDVAHERAVHEGYRGLGAVNRQGPEPRAVAGGENHRAHLWSSAPHFSSVCAKSFVELSTRAPRASKATRVRVAEMHARTKAPQPDERACRARLSI